MIPSRSRTADNSFAAQNFVHWFIRYRLRSFRAGRAMIELPNGQSIEHVGVQPGPTATLVIHRWRVLWRLVYEGEHGLARSYVDGDWSTPDLFQVMSFGLANVQALTKETSGWRLAHALNGMGHFSRSNTRRGSRRNIAQHYDLGNAFYGQWLDPEMNYSSGLYSDGVRSLEASQVEKLDRVKALLDVRPGHKVLEIGCGWGAFARRLISDTECTLYGITLSKEQLAHAKTAHAKLQSAGQADFALRDYRDVDEAFDRIVSIEMIEAVGERYWSQYFERLKTCLKPGGVAVLQAITINERIFESYRRRPDFIQRYIFPGGMLPTERIIYEQATRAGLEVTQHQRFGDSYAETLLEWRMRFERAWPAIAELGFDERFRRMWRYYLVYCEVGFRHRQTDVGLFQLRHV